MSSHVGVIFIGECFSTITIGDGNKLTPLSQDKQIVGAGDFDIGDLKLIINNRNKTEVMDNDIIDQGFILNL